MLTGVVGDSRQAIFQVAFDKLPAKFQLVRLNGLSLASHEPRGALSFLISKIDIAGEPSRHELVHALAAFLCPEGRPSVMLLGHPEHIDEQSASILVQLSAMRKIVLVVLCERLQDLPQDLLSFHRSGQLSHMHMPSLSLVQSRSCLEGELGGPLSTLAVATLRYLTNSNHDLMLKLARIWLAENQLEQSGGYWILRSGELRMGPALTAMLNAMLSGLHAPQRKLLYAMAVGGPVSVGALHRNGWGRQLEELTGNGLIKIIQNPGMQAVINVRLLSLLLVEVIDDDLNITIEKELEALHLDPAAARAHAAIQSKEDQGNTDSLIEIAEAFRETGYTSSSWAKDPEHRIAILKIHVGTLLALDRVPEAATLLAQAETGLRGVQGHPDAADRVELAQQELKILGTRIMTTAESRAPVPESRIASQTRGDAITWRSESQHYRARMAQSLDWAARGRQMDALAAVDQIATELSRLRANGKFDAVLSTEDSADLELMMLQTQLLAGSWHAASVSAKMLVRNQLMKPKIVAFADSVQGILHGFFDEPERALRTLIPALQQLSFISDPAERAAVEAVATYALVTMGDSAAAIELLLKEPDATQASLSLDFLSWVAEAFSSMAVARINDPKYAHSRLAAIAGKLRDAGYAGLEIHTLAIALRLGNVDVSERLERAARGCQGIIARRYAELANTFARGNSAELLTALEGLVETGQLFLSTSSPNALLDILEPREKHRLATVVLRRKRQFTAVLDSDLSDDNQKHEMPTWTRILTRRESQIALLAIDGQRNSEIARHSGVSIRTVEGHLYQVYSKLQVRNRRELTSLARGIQQTQDKI